MRPRRLSPASDVTAATKKAWAEANEVIPGGRNHISASHTQEDIDRNLQAAKDVLKSLSKG